MSSMTAEKVWLVCDESGPAWSVWYGTKDAADKAIERSGAVGLFARSAVLAAAKEGA